MCVSKYLFLYEYFVTRGSFLWSNIRSRTSFKRNPHESGNLLWYTTNKGLFFDRILSRKWKFAGDNTRIQEVEGSRFADVASHTGPFISADVLPSFLRPSLFTIISIKVATFSFSFPRGRPLVVDIDQGTVCIMPMNNDDVQHRHHVISAPAIRAPRWKPYDRFC